MSLLLLWAGPALGQAVPSAEGNVQTMHTSVDARRTLWTDDTTRSPDGYFQGKGAVSWTHRPLIWEWSDGRTEAVVGSAFQLDAIGAVSYGGGRLGLILPLILGGSSDVFATGTTGLGDIALDGKFTFLDPRDAPLGIAATTRVTVPTATVDTPLGDVGPTVEVAAVADTEVGPVLLAVNLGTRIGPPTVIGPTTVDDQLVYRLGGGYELNDDLGLSGELSGRIGYTSTLSEGAPLEATIGGWAWVSADIVARLGVGVGLGSAIGTPGARAVVSMSYEPPRILRQVEIVEEVVLDTDPNDVDGDGVTTDDDACPEEPEDPDGYKDEDGCPDPETLLGVRVQDPAGATAQGAYAWLTCGDGAFDKRLTADQSVEVLPSTCAVDASGPGWLTESLIFDVPEGAPLEKILILQPDGERGRVTIAIKDPLGNPIEQAAWAFGNAGFTRIHEGVGAASVALGTHTVKVGGKGFAPTELEVEVTADSEVPLDVVLKPN